MFSKRSGAILCILILLFLCTLELGNASPVAQPYRRRYGPPLWRFHRRHNGANMERLDFGVKFIFLSVTMIRMYGRNNFIGF
ncbi:hypothetical protein HHI36_012113 [Cryptolaemus montrouzieri]|uniref:Uncharacterized protein n=1 Tax=Cryptolaemus montrouzieri TaxID=559131 RepID=A0ABD2NDP3_9CUCU